MSLFAISDLHLSLGTNKPMDIFNGWDNYIERLEKNWNSIISDKDTVVITGDISWALKMEDSKEDLEFIDSLPGKKIFIKGNHDYWWGTKSKMEKFFKENSFNTLSVLFNCTYEVENFAVCGSRGWFYDCDNDADRKILLREVARLQTSVELASKTGLEPIAFIHYPPVYSSFECKEILEVLKNNNIKKCYYGHLHGTNSHNKAIIGEYQGIDFKLISCDYIKFMPLLVR